MNIVFWALILLALFGLWILLCFLLPIETIVDKIMNKIKKRIYCDEQQKQGDD